jgi:hypothetical protein
VQISCRTKHTSMSFALAFLPCIAHTPGQQASAAVGVPTHRQQVILRGHCRRSRRLLLLLLLLRQPAATNGPLAGWAAAPAAARSRPAALAAAGRAAGAGGRRGIVDAGYCKARASRISQEFALRGTARCQVTLVLQEGQEGQEQEGQYSASLSTRCRPDPDLLLSVRHCSRSAHPPAAGTCLHTPR